MTKIRSRENGRRGWPVQAYLVAPVVLLIIVAATAAGYGWMQADRDARRSAELDASFAARLAATELANGITSVRSSVEQVAASPSIDKAYTDPKSCQLSLALPGGEDAGHLDLLRSDGSVVCSSRRRPPAASGYADADWLSGALSEPLFRVPVADPATGAPSVLATVPVPGYGMMAGFVNLRLLGPGLAAVYGGPRRLEFLVVDADTILARSVDPARWVGARPKDTPFGTATTGGERRGVTGVPTLYGRADVPGLGWELYAGADRAAALATARWQAERQLTIVAIGLLAALAAALVVYRRITRPIGRLSTAVRSAAAAPDEATAVTVSGPAEVTGLADDVNILVSAVQRELAERRRAEKAARELERSYRNLFDSSPYPKWVFDAETLAILDVNDAAVARYGYGRDEFLALSATDLTPPEDADAVTEAIRDAAAVQHSGPLRHIRSDGATIEVRVTSHALTFNGRDCRCAVVEDITERERLERRLRQSERLESLGQLAGGVAHDFNNLLGIIAGYATFAADDLADAARADPRWQQTTEDLGQVMRAVDRATALTRQLLAFARRDVVRPGVLDLNAVVAEVEQMLRRTLGEDIQLQTQLSADPPLIKADPGQLDQILVNLAVNARDAMPTGGTLVIETDNVNVDDDYAATHPGARRGRYVRLRVSDTGTGMSPATVERAFEPFFTTKPKGQGTGLGLATIYGIITEAGGHAEIYSEPGIGTTVTALLPATAETATAASVADAAPPPGRGETILVVEDEERLRVLTQRILARHGYRIITAGDGPEALAVAAGHPGPIDLLLTDVVMPHMLGHDLARRIRDSRPELPVIYMSGYAESVLTAHKTLPSGVTLLSKPVNEPTLLNALRQVLDGTRPRVTRSDELLRDG